MGQCPYCSKDIKDGARFCLGCGRQLDVEVAEGPKSGGISDLKQCFGSFPVTKIDCYLCADEQKCSNFAVSTRQHDILSKLDKIENLHAALSEMNDTLKNMSAYLRSMDNNIASMTSSLKRLK